MVATSNCHRLGGKSDSLHGGTEEKFVDAEEEANSLRGVAEQVPDAVDGVVYDG